MVGKVSERVLLREGMLLHHILPKKDADLWIGLERTDNGMKLSSWPDVAAINQKNYYTYGQCLAKMRALTSKGLHETR